jgi:N6-adenosine-specific RNA methylase IME4
MSAPLVKYDEARRALAEAHRVDEVKDIADKAAAMHCYARQARDSELIAHATEIRKRAERRLGELICEQREAGKLATGKEGKRKALGSPRDPRDRPTLAEQGVGKALADRARKAAALPQDQFEALVAQTVKVAVAATEGDREVIRAARVEQQAKKRARRREREHELGAKIAALRQGQFGLIVADDNWDCWSRETGLDRHAALAASDAHTAEQMHERTKDRFECAAADCLLAMWSTVQHHDIAMDLLRLRGFRYVSHYVWGKDKIGHDSWNRNKHEVLLLGVRGKIPCPAPDQQWDSLIEAPVGEHSTKPDCFLEMLEQYFPTLPKIELNRSGPPRQGWSTFGTEVERAGSGVNLEGSAARKAAYAVDVSDMISDPTKAGIPLFLQTQNRRPS